MPPVEYIAADGDQLDGIAWRHYGRSTGTFEAVHQANPHLLTKHELAAGDVVILPDVPPPSVERAVRRLWD